MTSQGWIFFAIGWGIVGAVAFWCFYRLMRKPPQG
jgi:hypothetical protein